VREGRPAAEVPENSVAEARGDQCQDGRPLKGGECCTATDLAFFEIQLPRAASRENNQSFGVGREKHPVGSGNRNQISISGFDHKKAEGAVLQLGL
jgi:hypothetical protein